MSHLGQHELPPAKTPVLTHAKTHRDYATRRGSGEAHGQPKLQFPALTFLECQRFLGRCNKPATSHTEGGCGAGQCSGGSRSAHSPPADWFRHWKSCGVRDPASTGAVHSLSAAPMLTLACHSHVTVQSPSAAWRPRQIASPAAFLMCACQGIGAALSVPCIVVVCSCWHAGCMCGASSVTGIHHSGTMQQLVLLRQLKRFQQIIVTRTWCADRRTATAKLSHWYLQGQLIALFTSDAQVIAQATAVLPLVAFAMVSNPPDSYCLHHCAKLCCSRQNSFTLCNKETG